MLRNRKCGCLQPFSKSERPTEQQGRISTGKRTRDSVNERTKAADESKDFVAKSRNSLNKKIPSNQKWIFEFYLAVRMSRRTNRLIRVTRERVMRQNGIVTWLKCATCFHQIRAELPNWNYEMRKKAFFHQTRLDWLHLNSNQSCPWNAFLCLIEIRRKLVLVSIVQSDAS